MIKKININLGENFKQHNGYLINLKEFEEIKIKINYEKNKHIKLKHNFLALSKSEGVDKKYYTLDEIEFRNSDYLLNMLFNGNKYIFINKNLWKLLCKEGKENTEPIIYEINYSKIKFMLDDHKVVIFANNHYNQISSETFYQDYNSDYSLYKSNYENIVKGVFMQIKEFYEFERYFQRNLKNFNKTNYNTGYLIDINWFDKWKKFNDYFKIKYNDLEKNKSKKDILDHIIYVQQLNKTKGILLEEPKVYKFDNKNELLLFLKRNELALIEASLFSLCPDLSEKKIYYYLYNNKIEFLFGKDNTIIFDTRDNIISLKNENNEEHLLLLQLIKIFYFRKFLRSEILREYKIKVNNNFIILIKKEIINQYLAYLNIKI